MRKKTITPVLTVVLMVVLLLVLVPRPCRAADGGEERKKWGLEIESGMVFSGYNDVRSPNEGGTLFSLSEDLSTDEQVFLRIRLNYAAGKRHTLSLLYAPLSLEASGIPDKNIHFEGGFFGAGEPLRGSYRFNSYRLTYRYTLVDRETLHLGLGFTAKIRDAEVRLESASVSSKSNVGFVPLVNIYLRWKWGKKTGLLLEADALAAPQGRAEDVLTAVFYRFSPTVAVRLGYRFIEGGADSPEVYTFAWLHYASAGLELRF